MQYGNVLKNVEHKNSTYVTVNYTAWEVSKYGVISNTGKYGPEITFNNIFTNKTDLPQEKILRMNLKLYKIYNFTTLPGGLINWT